MEYERGCGAVEYLHISNSLFQNRSKIKKLCNTWRGSITCTFFILFLQLHLLKFKFIEMNGRFFQMYALIVSRVSFNWFKVFSQAFFKQMQRVQKRLPYWNLSKIEWLGHFCNDDGTLRSFLTKKFVKLISNCRLRRNIWFFRWYFTGSVQKRAVEGFKSWEFSLKSPANS